MTKSAHTRASLLPYPIIAAAVAGDAEAVSRVVRHYSSYIAALSTRTSYGSDGYPRLQVDAEKVNGVWEQRLRIHYNCVGTIEIPSALPLPTPDVSVNTRKGVVVNYAPCDVAI